MTGGNKVLAFFDEWVDPAGPEMVAAIPGVDVVRMDATQPFEENWPVLEAAHGYQLRPSTETLPEFYPNAELIRRCPNLLAISSAGAGYDMVDVEACTEAGVLLFNQTGANAESVVQHALAMMLTLSKQLIQSDRAIRGQARDWTRWDYTGRELTKKTVGIVGLGNIGRRLAAICGSVFDMRVLAYDPYISDDDVRERGAERAAGLPEMFAESDFISVHCPLTDETRCMVSGALFDAMKPEAFFITTARGGIHDEAALENTLRAGRIAGAGLDVFEEEPPAFDHPLLGFENVIVSPHNAGVTLDCNYNMAVSAAEQWADLFAGGRPSKLVNTDAWEKFQGRYQSILGLNAAD
ncbi:MAG: hydroxyacid dehydrogenase [Rhodospirillaceae bacterium]|nr:hydroxyacid dehydrogenase [Rhodospirillaceae bacterium]